MAELIRSIASRLREYIGNRRRALRHSVRLSCSVSLLERQGGARGARRLPMLEGYTRDISATGLALILPAIRIGEHYLSGTGRPLHLVLEIPAGPICLWVVAVRYERLDQEPGPAHYLLGVRITEMEDEDRARFNEYLKAMMK